MAKTPLIVLAPTGNWRHQPGRAKLHLWFPLEGPKHYPICGARIILAHTVKETQVAPYTSKHACYDCLAAGVSRRLAQRGAQL
jgi:hypothetical protein